MNRFNDLAELTQEQVESLLELASRLERHPEPRALEGKVLSLLFLSPSLRTLASFQAAMIRLGGGAFVISPEMSIHGLESRSGIVMDGAAAEHVREAVPVIASYGDALGVRAFAKRLNLDDDLADREFLELASLAGPKPWINMESAINAAARGAGGHRAHGGDARHGCDGAAAAGLRAAPAGHGSCPRGRGAFRRPRDRDQRSK
jgi:N-acetylornithine carbamoyltransferase